MCASTFQFHCSIHSFIDRFRSVSCQHFWFSNRLIEFNKIDELSYGKSICLMIYFSIVNHRFKTKQEIILWLHLDLVKKYFQDFRSVIVDNIWLIQQSDLGVTEMLIVKEILEDWLLIIRNVATKIFPVAVITILSLPVNNANLKKC